MCVPCAVKPKRMFSEAYTTASVSLGGVQRSLPHIRCTDPCGAECLLREELRRPCPRGWRAHKSVLHRHLRRPSASGVLHGIGAAMTRLFETRTNVTFTQTEADDRALGCRGVRAADVGLRSAPPRAGLWGAAASERGPDQRKRGGAIGLTSGRGGRPVQHMFGVFWSAA